MGGGSYAKRTDGGDKPAPINSNHTENEMKAKETMIIIAAIGVFLLKWEKVKNNSGKVASISAVF